MGKNGENKEIILCRCEEVTAAEIQKAIEQGACTLKGIKKRTSAGMGLCQGRTCSRLIMQQLAQKIPRADIKPDTVRPPVRTLKIKEFLKKDDEPC